MPAPFDADRGFLAAAYPFNSEWLFTDASPYIRGDGATGNHVARINTAVSVSTSATQHYTSAAFFNGNDSSAVVSGTTIDIPGDFTMETWIRFSGNNVMTSDQHFLSVRDASGNGVSMFRDFANGNRLGLFMGSTFSAVVGTTILANNTWYHVAAIRSGSTVRLYVNGVQEYTGTPSAFTVGQRKITVGGRWDGTFGLNGFIQDARIYIGKAKYASNFTPPTAIVDFSNNTSNVNQTVLGIPFNNVYRFADASSQIRGWGANIAGSAVNDLVISTAQSKFYGQSALFDGSEDHVFMWAGNGHYVGRNDFTIEGWFYHLGTADDTIFNDPNTFTLTYGASGRLRFYTGGGANLVDANTNYISNQWVHVAAVRSNGTLTFYQNGTAVGSHAYDFDIGVLSSIHIGKFSGGNTQGWHGYMNDLRIYNGVARYTSNFTPTNTAMATTPSVSTSDGMKLIGQITVTSVATPVVEFTGIPQDFRNLYLVYSPKTNAGVNASTLIVRINGITSSTYDSRVTYGEGTGAGGFPYGVGSTGHFGYCGTTLATFNQVDTFGGSEAWFFNYNSSNMKSYVVNSFHVSNAANPATYQNGIQGIVSGGNSTTTPIYSILIGEAAGGLFMPDSTFYLYGLKG
jgi:hypothetical protein